MTRSQKQKLQELKNRNMKRFYCGSSDGMIEDKEGDYIMYSDYEKILFGLLKGRTQDFKPIILNKYIPPFRVGRKQGKAILDSNGLQLGFMPSEEIATIFCDFLNKTTTLYS